jgi:inorganic pyrophosphatase
MGIAMGLKEIPSGKNLPKDVNVVVEIPMNGPPVKYEVDKTTGALFVDRFMSTAMFYPANYGYIPQTLSLDGDPVDVLVVTPVPLQTGTVISCRPVGMLKMTDESGEDAKLIAVPSDKLCQYYRKVESYRDLPQPLLLSIEHFFAHYKDLEEGKWVRIDGWDDISAAHQEILDSIKRYQEHQ